VGEAHISGGGFFGKEDSEALCRERRSPGVGICQEIPRGPAAGFGEVLWRSVFNGPEGSWSSGEEGAREFASLSSATYHQARLELYAVAE
jgi:hypothetical protein